MDELCTHPSLSRLGAEALHGGLSQAAREACLERFRKGRTNVRATRGAGGEGGESNTHEPTVLEEHSIDSVWGQASLFFCKKKERKLVLFFSPPA